MPSLRGAGQRAKVVWKIARRTLDAFLDHRATSLSAALAFYAALSMAPLLLVILGVGELVWGADAARAEILRLVESMMGAEAAHTVETTVTNMGALTGSGWAGVVGLVAVLFGTTVTFAHLQESLNTIWDVDRTKLRGGMVGYARGRFLSLLMVLIVGCLLVTSMAASAVMKFVVGAFDDGLPGPDALWLVMDSAVLLGIYALAFGLIFRTLPDTRVEWRDAALGGVVTALLFAIGKELIAFYLSGAAIGSALGAASSLAVLLAWVYYSSLILFLGAQFTQVYSVYRQEQKDRVPAEPTSPTSEEATSPTSEETENRGAPGP